MLSSRAVVTGFLFVSLHQDLVVLEVLLIGRKRPLMVMLENLLMVGLEGLLWVVEETLWVVEEVGGLF